MTRITTLSTAVPPHVLYPEQAKRLITDVFPLEPGRAASVGRIVDKSGIASRYSVFPSDYMKLPRDLTTDTLDYRDHALDLARRVVLDCLASAGRQPAEIDILISVSCTGILMPSLDAYLINQLGFRRNVIRLPITELGCMGGAAGIARASELARAYPDKNILLVSVDPSPANLVSSAIFGDGAVAVLFEAGAQAGIEVIDVESILFPDTLDAMGFDMKNEGLHIVLSKDVPNLVRGGIGTPTRALLDRHGLSVEQVSAWVLHGGGRKILEYVEEELELPRGRTQPSWDIMRDYGNMSSATVLFVLNEWHYRCTPAPGSYGVLIAFGPGLSAELALLRWG
jgi:alkylresorcinol/alkylpyrone synthase